MTKASKFYQDPRLKEAKRLVLECLKDAQKEFHGVEGPKNDDQLLLEEFAKVRSLPLYYPYIGSGFGAGPLVELVDGSVKYDMISGIGVHYLGHSHSDLVASSFDAALSDTVMQGNLQQNADALELSQRLLKESSLDHCFLSTSGAMACENALKICFQKNYPKTRVLAFERAFAGRTLALSQITDKPSFREGLPVTIAVDYIPFFDFRNPHESIERTLDILRGHVRRYPRQHAVMCMELVQGEGGFWVGSEEFFKALIDVLKEHSIAIWADEIQTFARTEKLFAFQFFNLQNLIDIVTIGKVSPACATLFRKEFAPKAGLLSQTFTASTSAIRASLTIIDQALQSNFFGPNGFISQIYNSTSAGFSRLHQKYGCVHGPYGIGSMLAFTPFDGSEEVAKKFAQKLFHNGVISFVAGSNPTRLRFLPPVGAISLQDIEAVLGIIEKTIQEFKT